MLSPHHRLSLIVEVVIGLVDDTAPLPPDTLEHYSAYFALYSFVFNQIEVEIDMHGNGSPEYQEQMFQPNKGDADRYGKAKSLDDPMADWNHQGPREDLEERKYNKQINKQLHSFEKHHTARNNTNNTNNSNGDSCSDTNSDRDRDVEGMDHNQKQLMSMLTRTWGCSNKVTQQLDDAWHEKDPKFPVFPYNNPIWEEWQLMFSICKGNHIKYPAGISKWYCVYVYVYYVLCMFSDVYHLSLSISLYIFLSIYR